MKSKPMKGEPNRKQHYIPQCYLKWFADEKGVTNIYNKSISKAYPKSISDVGCANYFYRIPEKYIDKEEPYDKDFFEKEFFAENIESQFSSILNTIHENVNENRNQILSNYDRDIFAALIAIQYLRLPRKQSQIIDLYRKLNDNRLDIIKSIFKTQCPEKSDFIDSIQIEYNEDQKSIEHSEIYCDEELVNDYQDQLINKIWVFKKSDNNVFTSDNPIMAKPHLQNQVAYYEGFGMNGVEVIFPLGNSLILSMYDGNHFSELKDLENSVIKISDKETREYNVAQYMYADVELYSKANDFLIPNLLREDNGGKEIYKRRGNILVNGK